MIDHKIFGHRLVIDFHPLAKKLELVQIFNTEAGYVTADDGCFPKPKQFYFADKHYKKKIDNHVVDSCQRTCKFHFYTGWLLWSCFVIK